ncbi:MAG: integrase arm-type DNA-binding domain-containing protein [Gemmatimonadota bacterium]|nr:integrase arm-type DNA-binding domain-containing protein [Gemmatimonadota bacterium]
MPNLTAAKVRTIKKSGMHGDGNGLYLNVTHSGSRSWIQRIVIGGRRRDLGLGGYPGTGLAEARRKAIANKALVVAGRDPVAERRSARVPTFRVAAERVYKANLPRWRNGHHTKTWWQSLERHAFPAIGDIRVDRIGRSDVLAVLEPIWSVRQETARRVRQRIRTILRWCEAHEYCAGNAAGEALDGALPTLPRVTAHLRALPYQHVTEALEVVEASGASKAAKMCLRFLVLTAARSGEARRATWDQIDEVERLWVIPADRMKGGAEHRQPLSAAALAVLGPARVLRDESGLIFPSPLRRGCPLSNMSLTKVLRDTSLAARTTVHGFRTSFRTWASERTNASHAVMELSLAHVVGSSVERAYARSDLLAKRRGLMEQWGKFVAGDGAGVVRVAGQGAGSR